MVNYLEKTIEQLEEVIYPEPDSNSYVVTNVYNLRKKIISKFSNDDLRFMIGQKEALEYLLPIAANKLKHEPLLEAYNYSGDLLCSFLDLEEKVWQKYPELELEVTEVLKKIAEIPEEIKLKVENWLKKHN
jgi:hypothetical protein